MNKGRMSKTNIDWPGLTHTWNPLIGCKHQCPYCIAEKWNKRYHWISKWDEPKIFQERMNYPYKEKKPCSIFVVFLGDLFGKWIDSDFIRSVIKVTEENKQHTFWFLTKNPRRYQYFEFDENCKLGATITGEDDLNDFDDLIKGSLSSDCRPEIFISVEPIKGKVPDFYGYESIDLVIVGAQTNPNVAPKKEWIQSIRDNVPAEKIYWKKNIQEYL